MKFIIPLILIVSACTSKPSNEMEAMTRDVLKSKQGMSIVEGNFFP